MSKEYRHSNGKRLDGHGLIVRLSQEIKGMVLSQAYVLATSAGFLLRVAANDGVHRNGFAEDGKDDLRINVDVSDGYVKRTWVR